MLKFIASYYLRMIDRSNNMRIVKLVDTNNREYFLLVNSDKDNAIEIATYWFHRNNIDIISAEIIDTNTYLNTKGHQ